MNCKKCGNEMASTEIYCQSCGTKADDTSSSYQSQTQPTQNNYNQPAQQNQNPYTQPTQQQNPYSQPQQNQNTYDYQNPYTNQQPVNNSYANSPEAVSSTMPLVLSIIVTIFCNQILGIIAIVYAAKISNLNTIGDFEGAQKASKTSITLSMVGIGLTVLLGIIIFILMLSFPAMLSSFSY